MAIGNKDFFGQQVISGSGKIKLYSETFMHIVPASVVTLNDIVGKYEHVLTQIYLYFTTDPIILNIFKYIDDSDVVDVSIIHPSSSYNDWIFNPIVPIISYLPALNILYMGIKDNFVFNSNYKLTVSVATGEIQVCSVKILYKELSL